MGTRNLCFEQKYEKYQIFYPNFFHFWVVIFSVYLNRRVFVMNDSNTDGSFAVPDSNSFSSL